MALKLRYIKQNIPAQKIDDLDFIINQQIKDSRIDLNKFKDKTVGITVGSRGIDQITDVLKEFVRIIENAGGKPFLIPAMGSHGGAKLEGQLQVLESLNITEENINVPIIKNIEVDFLGESSKGRQVYCNKAALSLDHIIVMNRIKSHTDFTGNIESGLCKMMAIGLGSYKGAQYTHSYALNEGHEDVITDIAETMLEKLPEITGVGLIENWRNQLELIEIIPGDKIIEREKKLLAEVKNNKIDLPIKNIDVLIIQEMGKNISGTGMDTKVIGRIKIDGQTEPLKPDIRRIVVLSLTEESHGNAIGIGLADIITRKVFNEVDLEITSKNTITSMAPEQGKIPVVMSDDKRAILAAANSLGFLTDENLRCVFIKNTSYLEKLYISESLFDEVELNQDIEVIREEKLRFDSKNLIGNKFD